MSAMNKSRGRSRRKSGSNVQKPGSKKVSNANHKSPKNKSPNKGANANHKSPNKSPKASLATPKRPKLLPYDMKVTKYLSHEEPEFWKPLFQESEMFMLREKFHEIMKEDCVPVISGWKHDWSMCSIVKQILPTYFIPKSGKPYFPPEGGMYGISPNDFSRFNVIICASLLFFGIVNDRMSAQPYIFLLKGGKAIQIVLSNVPKSPYYEPPDYESEDIDILIRPILTKPYDLEEIKNLAGHLAELLKWFVEIPEIDCNVSIQPPEDSKFNPDIYKLSYPIPNTKAFKAFSDIDFQEIKEDKKVYYSKCIQVKKSIELTKHPNPFKSAVTFKCPNLLSLLNEKIYYYAKFKVMSYRDVLEEYTHDDCIRFMEKFKRAILALNKGLQTQKHPHISDMERIPFEIDFLLTTLRKINIPGINIDLVKDLYNKGVDFYIDQRMKELPPRMVKIVEEYMIVLIIDGIYA